MTAGKVNRANARPPPTRVTRSATPPAAPAALTTNGKKKKKKKSKGKGVERMAPVPGTYDPDELEDEDEDDEETALPPSLPPHSHPHLHAHRTVNRTGLSPELASVHVSTTASLSASLAAHLKPATAAEEELLATADHLARSMEGPEGGLVNDEYWASFPDHLRNFVRHTYSQLSAVGSNADSPLKTQAMYALATKGGGAGRHLPSAFQGMPFDPAIFADPQFAMAMEQAAAANGALQADGATLAPANVVLYPEDQEYGEEDYYSEDEVDDLEDELVGERRAQAAHFTLSFEDPLARPAAGLTAAAAAVTGPNGYAGPKKKNKKKKKKGAEVQAPGEEPAGVRPEEVEGGTVTNGGRPASAPNRMPAARPPPAAATNPPPSSRAAGKKPMAYNPAPAQDPPPPSRRAASKAPISSHQYGHNHTHHHPSPPSSNASAPHKPRPPATGQQPQKNSKIWSTSTTEERERIKEFWLGLGEEERRNLVKIEKEAVLKKMKEQQKHSCSCAVCGRKRYVVLCAPPPENFSSPAPPLLSSTSITGPHSQLSLDSVPPQQRNAIEEELEVLYDAYYEELEQYANYQQRYISSGGTLPPPQGPGPFPGSVELDKNGAVISPQPPAAHRGKAAVANGRKPVKHTESEFEEDGEDEYPEDDGYEDDEEEEEEEDDEEDEEDDGDPEDEDDAKQDQRTAAPRRRAANGVKTNGRDGLGNFGSNLTVTGKCLSSVRHCAYSY